MATIVDYNNGHLQYPQQCFHESCFLTSSEFYVPTFHFKPPFPEFRSQPEEGVHDVTDVTDDADVTDDVVTATAKLAAAVVNDDEPEVTSDLAEVFTSGRRQDGMSACKEVSTLTDVCYNENLAEVDLVSLIEEQLPRYVLRADTLTDFAGYDNSDWIQTPCLPLDTDLNLSPIIIEETLKYFTLCADRVSQMTKTYNDIEAVTRLLEEKERDLELAARIGQNLLDKNKELEEKNEQLEEQLVQANDSVAQLRHEISMKDALLHAYIQDYDSETPGESPNKALLGLGHIDGLQKKVRGLEEENLTLHYETAQLKTQTCDLEEKEEKLVKDAVRQLADINGQIHTLQDELFCKTEITIRQQEEITTLMAKIISLEAHIKRLTIENAELSSHVSAAQESQRELTTELGDQRDKYAELLVLLQETQEEAKALRGKAGPSAVRHQYGHYTPFLPQGSLAFELEDSLKKDMTYPEGYSPSDRRSHNKRVMETAKIVKRHGPRKSSSLMSIPGSSMSTSGNETCESIAGSSNRSSLYLSESESFNEGYSGDVDSNYGSGTTLGRPGIPGSNDLETALRRLTLRKANEINESILQEVDEKRKSGGSSTPTGYQTPDSLMSTGSGSNFSDLSRFSGGYSGYGFRIPEKLQIVKPMEGSMTLHQWQRLATPHLGGFLDPRPGIQIKGEKPLEEQEVYTLSDYEEDGMCLDLDSSFQPASKSTSIYAGSDSDTDTILSTSTPRSVCNRSQNLSGLNDSLVFTTAGATPSGDLGKEVKVVAAPPPPDVGFGGLAGFAASLRPLSARRTRSNRTPSDQTNNNDLKNESQEAKGKDISSIPSLLYKDNVVSVKEKIANIETTLNSSQTLCAGNAEEKVPHCDGDGAAPLRKDSLVSSPDSTTESATSSTSRLRSPLRGRGLKMSLEQNQSKCVLQ